MKVEISNGIFVENTMVTTIVTNTPENMKFLTENGFSYGDEKSEPEDDGAVSIVLLGNGRIVRSDIPAKDIASAVNNTSRMRRIYYINVGNLKSEQIEELIYRYRKMINANETIVDAFVPIREGQSRIESLS